MFKDTFTNSLINILPSVSQKITLLYGIGNEYTVLISLILTEITKKTMIICDEFMIFALFLIIGLLFYLILTK